MLKLDKITKKFKSDLFAPGFVALDEISFEVPEGSMVGYLGANGAGKTTSLKIIMDFIRADSGSVFFDTKLGSSRNEILRNIGFLPERPYFYPNLTGHEFLEFMGGLSGLSRIEIKESVKKWAERFKIDHALTRQLKTYSKGMLQRVGFMATILHGPKLIILDEPISGLDPLGRKELKDVIVEVHKEGKTIFFSSHIVPDVEEICDRVIFIQGGKLIYDGEVEKLLNSVGDLNYVIKYKSTAEFKGNVRIQKTERFPDNLFVCVTDEKNKDALIKELVEKNIQVCGVELVKPTLEEIFYKVRT